MSIQKTQQQELVRKIVGLVDDCINHTKINEEFVKESRFSILAVLYAFHKGYNIHLITKIKQDSSSNDDNLYKDLLELIPNDKNLQSVINQFGDELSVIDRNEFNTVYADVLRELLMSLHFHVILSSNVQLKLDVSKLIAYIVNKEQCKTVYNPFCGTAPIVYDLSHLEDVPQFYGQEIRYKRSIIARLNAEAIYGSDKCIENVDSILNWNKNHYDAVVSFPPPGGELSDEQIAEAERLLPNFSCRSSEDIALLCPLYYNNAKITITQLSIESCVSNNCYEFRKELVEKNLIDTIFSIPTRDLYGTGTLIILVCKKERKKEDPVRFINADKFAVNLKWQFLDYTRLITMLEQDKLDISTITPNEIMQNDYNLHPALYEKKHYAIKNGQQIVKLQDLLIPVKIEPSIPINVVKYIDSYNLNQDFIKTRLNINTFTEINKYTKLHVQLEYTKGTSKDKYLVYSRSYIGYQVRYEIITGYESFAFKSVLSVFKVNDKLVTPEYLVYILTNNETISKSGASLCNLLNLNILIEPIEKQKELVKKEIDNYNAKVEAERKAEEERLGVQQNISDLEHMLGPTQFQIDRIITRLEKELEKDKPSIEDYKRHVKSLKDHVWYMNRLIKYNSASIETFNIQEDNILDFINNYADSWKNYGGGYFELSVNNMIKDSLKICFDKTLLTVMLDSILNNAAKHGFKKDKYYTEHNTVQIELSVVEYREKPYLKLSVANNGVPIADGFTIEDYISKGRYSATSGRSGLGGHHVYQVVKGHKGFLCLDRNEDWNMIVDILLPVEFTKINNLIKYGNECI